MFTFPARLFQSASLGAPLSLKQTIERKCLHCTINIGPRTRSVQENQLAKEIVMVMD